MSSYHNSAKVSLVVLMLAALMAVLTGCLSNLPDILRTPTPTPSPDPDITIDPDIDLNPVGGYAGTLVAVAGQGWMPGKLVFLKLEDDAGQSDILAANITDSQGEFETSFVYPNRDRWLTPGFQTVVAYMLNEDLSAATQFVVIEPTSDNTPTATSTSTGTPTATSSATPISTNTSTATLRPTATPNEQQFPTSTPSTTVVSTVMAEVQEQTATVQATATGTATQTPTAAATSEPTATPFQFLLLPTVSATTISLPTATDTPLATALSTPTVAANPTDDATDVAQVIGSDQVTTPASGQQATATPDFAVNQPDNGQPVSTANGTAVQQPFATPTPFFIPATPTIVTPTWTPQPTVIVIEEWRGDYWNNVGLAGTPVVVRNDQSINFDWGSGAPANNMPSDSFSARWIRSIFFDAGVYTFEVEVDDGARLFVDGELLIDAWNDGARRKLTAQKVLSDGQHRIILEYYERNGVALVSLDWTKRTVFNGWRGEYFANVGLNGQPVVVRDDERIDFEWATGSPSPNIPDDRFSVRWQREVAFSAGIYRFTATSDDGIRVWLDDRLIIDEWRDQSEQAFSVEIPVSERAYNIRVEYYENTLGAIAKFDWAKLSEPVPQSTPTWTPRPIQIPAPTPTWTPDNLVPTPTWTPSR